MTLLELAQRGLAGFLLLAAVKISLVCLWLSWGGIQAWIYALVGVAMAWVLVQIARYPFSRPGTEKQLWIW